MVVCTWAHLKQVKIVSKVGTWKLEPAGQFTLLPTHQYLCILGADRTASSFDRDTRGQDEQSGEYNVAAYEQTNHDLENHQQYTDQYINSLEPPLGYRDETGGSNDPSSSRRRARHRVRDVLNADYYMSTSNGGSSSASGASGPYSSRRHGSSRQHHHGYKINKHAGKDNRKYSKH